MDEEPAHRRDTEPMEEEKARARKEWRTQAPSGRHEAYAVETVVVPERGQWAVDVVVVFEDEVVRHRIDTYRTERLARISADLIRRTALRELPGGPING
ncbi:hypothetical protein L615_006900000170 [Nocardioides sp. J9]|uniref:hypothetical protein n=1 Tax=Nocardioides sp. J9 TaxID=935844 RepID=UPI0011AC9E19|nr:hypothetical protein [Nocardioides sp. J9]TWG92783.1 hypothetical protein L615_006900000170 [Nocardioides sp. J9]